MRDRGIVADGVEGVGKRGTGGKSAAGSVGGTGGGMVMVCSGRSGRRGWKALSNTARLSALPVARAETYSAACTPSPRISAPSRWEAPYCEGDEIREDARRGRTLTTAQAIGYGLIQKQETTPRPPVPGGPPRPGPAGPAPR